MTETNTIFNDKVHDEERNENDARTDDNDDDITKGYNEREWDGGVGTNTNNDDITRGYK